MKYLPIYFLLLAAESCFAQSTETYKQLMESGIIYSKNADYRKALNKFNAAKLYDPSKAVEVDKQIDVVFNAIENKKDEAIEQKNIATQALKLTQEVKAKITNIYTALSWTFQANDLNPNQGLQVLRKAYLLTGEDTSATKIIKGQIVKNFNSSITHQYREKSRLEIKDAGNNYVTDIFLVNDKWLEVVYNDQTIKNFELQKDKTFKPLANELKVVNFFARGDTIIRVFMYKPIKKDSSAYKIVYEVTGKYPKILKTEDSLKTVRYLNGDLILTQSKDNKFKLWQTFGDVKPVNINLHENPDKFAINVENKKLLALVSNKLRIFDITTGLEKDTIGNENLNFFISNNFREMIDSNLKYKAYFSPNGKYLVIGFSKSTYLLQIFENLKLYKLQESDVWSINFSPDDKWVAIKDEYNKIKFFETSTGKEINFLRNEDKSGYIIFSKDSKWLISHSYISYKYRLWNMDTYKKVSFLPTEDSIILDIFFSPDGKSVSIITNSMNLRIFDLKSGKLLFHINDIGDDANYEFSSDSKWLIKTNFNSFDYYNVSNGQKIEFLKDETQILKAAFFTTSNLFAAIDKKNILKLWHFDSLSIENKFYDFDKSNFFKKIKIYNNNWMVVTDKQENKNIIKIDSLSFLTFLNNEKNIKFIKFSPDYKWLVSTTNNTESTIGGNKKNHDEIAHENKIWEIATGSEPDFLKGLQIEDASFSSDSNWLQIIEKANYQRFYNLKNRNEAFFLKNLKIKKSKFSNDSRMLFTEDEVGNRKVWNMFSGEAYSMNNIGFPNEVSFSNDNKWLVAIYRDTITNKYSGYNDILWYINSGRQYFKDDNKEIKAFLFSPYANWLATQNLEDEVALWDVTTKKMIKKINKDDFFGIKFSSDGKLAFIQIKNDIYIIQKDVVINELKLTNIDSVSSFSISSDNKWIVISDKSKSITIKEIPTLFDLFVKRTEQILAVKFSPDNKFLMASYLGGQYKLWNLSTKSEVKLNEKENKIINYKFSDDSSTLLLFFNNCLKIYDFSTGTVKQVVNENVSIEDISYFSHKWLINRSNHKLFVRNLENQRISDTLWTNLKVTDVILLPEDILLVKAGDAIIKLDLKIQKGNIFSYGDSETMDYSFDEIQEWIRLFGDQYLEPLSDETKAKFDIKEEKINSLIKHKR